MKQPEWKTSYIEVLSSKLDEARDGLEELIWERVYLLHTACAEQNVKDTIRYSAELKELADTGLMLDDIADMEGLSNEQAKQTLEDIVERTKPDRSDQS